MNNFISEAIKYRRQINNYENWQRDKNNGNMSKCVFDAELLKKKAQIISEPILLFDKYEHDKAEDSETFFQTLNIELMSLTAFIASLPVIITSAIPFLNKYKGKSKLIARLTDNLNKYKNKTLNIGKNNIPLQKALMIPSAIFSGLLFYGAMKKSMKSQLGLIRKASFDASNDIIDNPQIFAQLTPEQQKEVDMIVCDSSKKNYSIVDKLKDKVSINSTFKSVKDYLKNKNQYENNKKNYFEKIIKNTDNINVESTKNEDKTDKVLMAAYVKNVENGVLETLRKVETISNISYSALFTGGFLEYLLTDKLVEVLKITNKPLSFIVKLGVPLVTYLLLNKNISDIENKAILATKYKYLKNFKENPLNNQNSENNKNENLFKFIKTVFKDIKDYDKFSQTELEEIQIRLDAKKKLKMTDSQIKEGETLKENTKMALNNHRENVYESTLGIRTLSEIFIEPVDILATAIGAKIGNILSKKSNNPKLSRILMGLGAVLAFIPAAITEAKLTKEQKTAEKIAAMDAYSDIENVLNFKSHDNKNLKSDIQFNKAEIFKDFVNHT